MAYRQQDHVLVDGQVIGPRGETPPARIFDLVMPMLSFCLFLFATGLIGISFVLSTLSDTTAIEATLVEAPFIEPQIGEVALIRQVEFVIRQTPPMLSQTEISAALPPPPVLTANISSDGDAQLTPPVVTPTVAGRTWPRLKPTRVHVAQILTDRPLAKPVRIGQVLLVDDTPVAFADIADFTGGTEPLFPLAPSRPMVDRIEPQIGITTIKLAKGETLSDALTRIGVNGETIRLLATAFNQEFSVRRLRPGMVFNLTTKPKMAAPGLDVTSLEMSPKPGTRVIVSRKPDGFSAATLTPKTEIRYATLSGTISTSLFGSAERAGMPRSIAAKLANLFLYDIDFQRDIRRGDEFEVVFEIYFDQLGNRVAYGDVIYGRLSWRNKKREKGYYRYTTNKRKRWFDTDGVSAKRLLMKTPIEGARITSSYGRRKHPVLGYTKKHKGVDFGARRGTPIMAAGDGKILRANRFGSFGNYVKIKHANGYETAYAHLKSFAKGIKKGRRVEQGQIIGYVGTTGRSTGPHLHYEVLKKRAHINPMKIEVSRGQSLRGKTKSAFIQDRNWVDAMRDRNQLMAQAD